MRAARVGSRSIAIARMPRPARSHSIATLPAPAPTSHSSSPSQRRQCARVTARTSALVSWPSCSKASSGRPGRSGRQRCPAIGGELDRHEVQVGEAAVPSSAAVACDRSARRAAQFLQDPDRGWRRSRCSTRQRPIAAGAAPSAVSTSSRRPGCRWRRRPATGRPWALSGRTSSSAQPSRLQASWKAETCGRIADLAGGTCAQQQPADTVPERVAGGEDGHAAAGAAPGARPACRPAASARPGAAGRPPAASPGAGAADQHLGAGSASRARPAEPVQTVGADADDGEPGRSRRSTSSALTAAAAMALPPRRPRSVIQGTSSPARSAPPCSRRHRRSRPGRPGWRPAARASSRSRSSRWNRAVGALPMATTAPARCGRHSSTAAAERVVAELRGQSRACARRRASAGPRCRPAGGRA